MNNFKQGGYRDGGGNSGGRPSFGRDKKFGNKFGGSRDGGDRGRGPMQLYPATCSECRKPCEVPFRPTGERPVYCRECFGKQPHVPGRNSNGMDRPGGGYQREARPAYERPAPAAPASNVGIESLTRQLVALESKVNRILEILNQKPVAPAVPSPLVKEVASTAKAIEAVQKQAKKAKVPAKKAVKKAKK